MTDKKALDELVRRSEERHHQAEVSVQGDDIMADATPEPVELPEAPKEEAAEETKLASGYTVGVKEDGGLFFQLHGDKKGTIELLGLNALAFKQIQTLVDANLNQGNPQLIQGLNAVFGKLLEIEQRLPPAPEPNNNLKLD